MNKRFVTADAHFGHENIARYCNRPDGWEDLIVSAWNSVVTEGDEVRVLGDFALFTDKKIPDACWLTYEQGEAILDRLNGRKVLLRGNHDQEESDIYLAMGFDNVIEEMFVDFELAKIPILFSHRAIEPRKARLFIFGDENSTRKYLNLHGHTHNERDDAPWIDGNIHYNVGVDRMGYAPIEIDAFVRKLRLNR